MTHPHRTVPVPGPGDLRTCANWSCIRRMPAHGPDPAALMQVLEAAVDAVAASIVKDAELAGTPKPQQAYEEQFLQAYWTGVEFLADPPQPKRLVAEAEFSGLMCLEQLHTRILPRLRAAERVLLVDQPIGVTVPDGGGGTVAFLHRLARVGADRETNLIRAYIWRIDDPCRIDWMMPVRRQRTAIVLRYLAERYPGHQLASVQAYLQRDVLIESACTPDDLRSLGLVLGAQALLIADRESAPLGRSPITASRN